MKGLIKNNRGNMVLVTVLSTAVISALVISNTSTISTLLKTRVNKLEKETTDQIFARVNYRIDHMQHQGSKTCRYLRMIFVSILDLVGNRHSVGLESIPSLVSPSISSCDIPSNCLRALSRSIILLR